MKFGGIKVFKMCPEEGHELVLPVHQEDYERSTFEGESLTATWQPMCVRRVHEGQNKTRRSPSDLIDGSIGDLILTGYAKAKIGTILEQYGELLPLVCDDGEFWTLNVTCIIDALDEPQSVALKSSEPGRLLMISKYVFRRDALGNAVLFKIPQNRRGNPLVTTSFVEMIKSSGLTGLTFKQIWAPN